MTKSLTDIAKEQGADVIDEDWGVSFHQGTIVFKNEAQLKATFDAYNAQQDLISRDDAIQAILNVGGKRVWEFADAIRYLGKSESSKEYESMA